jgi:hypothetical protein
MIFEELGEFKGDVKGLMKRYRSIHEDLLVVKQVLSVYPDARPPFSFRVNGLTSETVIIKVKKIACKAIKGKGVNSGLRLTYAHIKNENRIVLIEVYHKGDKEGEDRNRILKYFS